VTEDVYTINDIIEAVKENRVRKENEKTEMKTM